LVAQNPKQRYNKHIQTHTQELAMNMTIGEFLDYIETLTIDNPDLLDQTLAGLVIDNEFEVKLEKA
jgi:hypothetical protein